MNCAFDKEKLTGYYDGELGAAEKAEVERHIASCSECLRDLGDLKSAAILVKELPRLRAPASIAQGVTLEIQAAGKVHGFARFRRTLLWGSAVAAGLFIGLNAMYFGSLKRESPMAAHAPSAAPMARALPRENAEKAEAESAAKAPADRSSPQNEELRKPEAARRELLERKSAAAVEEPKQAPGADALKKSDSKSQDELLREKSAPEPATKPVTAAPAATPAPAAPLTPPTEAPKPFPPPPAPTAKAEPAKPTVSNKDALKESDKEKDAPKVEQAAAPKPDPAAKLRGAAPEPRAELAPIHCTLSATQLARARTRLDEALKRMGVSVAAPTPAVKAPRRETDATLTIEISDAQLAALREELEKPGDAKLQQSNPVEPVLPQFKSGGIFAGGKKDTATAGAPAAKAKVEAGKEAEDAAAEPRRKVTLHLVEVKTLPADADDRAPKK
jgi:hypothetical protein